MKGMLRLEPRLVRPKWLSVAVPVGSIIVAAILGAIVITISGNDALASYARIGERSMGDVEAWSNTIAAATPLLLTGLAAAAAFKMGLFNIGGQGQFVLGAVAASGVGLALEGVNGFVTIPLMIVAGMAAGGLWAAIPGFFKVRFGTNEVITTLMLNYIAVFWNNYWIFGKYSDAGFQMTRTFPNVAWLPRLADLAKQYPVFSGITLHLGVVFGLVAAVIVWLIVYRSRWGYKINLIGDNPRAARYAGIDITRNIILVFMFSGALAGLAGMAEVSGVVHRLQERISTSYGFSGVIVAWLAKLNPYAVIVVSILFGALIVAGREIQPSGVSFMIQGTILFLVISSDVLLKYHVRLVRTEEETA